MDEDSDSDYRGHDSQQNFKGAGLQSALQDRDPIYIGTCPTPDHQRLLYYTNSGVHRCIDFSSTAPDDLEALYRACNPTEFVRNGESVFDESYCKVGKMDPTSFATLLDPGRLGIQDRVLKALLVENFPSMKMELNKLSVYGKGDFFKAHKDTPRGQNMFGSLVIILPTLHEGGQFVLRQPPKEWSLDFADKIATTTKPSISFIAFHGDLEHEVLPITSGYLVTLTYNLYSNPVYPATSVLSPYHLRLRQALADLVYDPLQLPDGGYLVSGLVHEYGQIRDHVIDSLLGRLKGSDRALADACGALGLPCSVRLFYRSVFGFSFLTTQEFGIQYELDLYESTDIDHLEGALIDQVTPEEAEGVAFIEDTEFHVPRNLQEYFKKPVSKVLEITVTQDSTVGIRNPFLVHENGERPAVQYCQGTACLVIPVGRAKSRRQVGL